MNSREGIVITVPVLQHHMDKGIKDDENLILKYLFSFIQVTDTWQVELRIYETLPVISVEIFTLLKVFTSPYR